MKAGIGIAVLLLASAPAAAQTERPAGVPRIEGLSYAEARARLVRAGWRPVEHAIDPTNPDLAAGNGPIFLARGYRELVSCAGTGLAQCRFAFRREGRLLAVVTAGEEPGARVHSLRVEPADRD